MGFINLMNLERSSPMINLRKNIAPLSKAISLFYLKSVVLLLIILGAAFGILNLNPYLKENYFYRATQAKYQKLKAAKGQKIIILSGSSAAYGINSAQMEKALGIPVVNMGISHLMGTKFLMEFIKNDIHKGDLVIYAREYLEGNATEHYGLIGEYAPTAIFATPTKLPILFSDFEFLKSALSGIHQSLRKSFQDFPKSDRFQVHDDRFFQDNNKTYKIVANEHDKETYKAAIPLPDSTWLEVKDLIAFKNFISDKGANLVLAPPGACEKGYNLTVTDQYISNMSRLSGVEILNGRQSSRVPSIYMHDSEFHPNYIGRYLRTKQLIQDLIEHGISQHSLKYKAFPALNLIPTDQAFSYHSFEPSTDNRTFTIPEYEEKKENYLRKSHQETDLSGHFYFLRVRCSAALSKGFHFRSWGGEPFDLIDEVSQGTYLFLKRLPPESVRNKQTLFGAYLPNIHLYGSESFTILEDGLYSDPGDILEFNVDTTQYQKDRAKLLLTKTASSLPLYLHELKGIPDKIVIMTTRGYEEMNLNEIAQPMSELGLSEWPLKSDAKVYSAVFSTTGKVLFETSDPKFHTNIFKGTNAISPFSRVELRNAHNGLITIDGIQYSEPYDQLTLAVFEEKTGELYDLLNVKLKDNPNLRIDRYSH